MSDERDEAIRRNGLPSYVAGDDQPIVVEGEERPIVVEEGQQQDDGAIEDWSLIEAEEEAPIVATQQEQPTLVRRPEPSAPPKPIAVADDGWPLLDAAAMEPKLDRRAEPPTTRAEFPSSREEYPATAVQEPESKGGGKRRKTMVLAIAGVAVVLVLGMLYRSLSAASGNPQPQTTAVVVAPTATTSVAAALPPSSEGALILINPGVVSQGSLLNVMGSGFKPNVPVDLEVMTQTSTKVLTSAVTKTDKNGTFSGASLTVPTVLSSGNFIVEAKAGNKTANAVGTVTGGAPQVKLGKVVGKPGDVIGVDAHGFSPGESINVYWNSIGGKPIATLLADSGGGVGLASVQVPFGVVGTNTFLFVGTKSQSLAATNILLLSLYPSVAPSTYMVRADNTLSFSGKGFGPGERVFAFLNNPNGLPVAVIQTNANGAFSGAGKFDVPFTMKGKQKVIFLGEQSRTTSTVAFTVQSYMPHAQASTYGGFPGTTVTFYGAGFARNEVVHVYVGSTQNSAGTMVSCFRTDATGNANAAGSYLVPGNVQTGTLTFALTGSKSGSTATASMNISPAPGPVDVPAQPPFTCPLDANP